ncbi:hypothetical protein HDU91_004491, partial [Kappamyces sp. JEL0680]
MQALTQATATKSLLLASAGIMISFETPTNTWPQLMVQVSSFLQSQDTNVLYTGLTVLLEIVKAWQWFQANKRAPLNAVVRHVFPSLLTIAQRLEPMRDHAEALPLLKTILKIYCYTIRMELPKELQSTETLVPWVTLFMAIVEWKWIPGASPALPDDEKEREKHMWWKCKKWAYAGLNSLMG